MTMGAVIRKISVIESYSDSPYLSALNEHRKKRVAAYARVSTDSDEQLSSYEAQVDFYTQHINNNPEWEFVSVYTDEGISGTNTKKRDGFNRMIADALSGNIDLILTKSISRFARNTVDTLTTVRKLKEKEIEVYFEKENIYTLDAKGEVLITIMSSLAQEESRSISENITWGKKKSMKDGKITLPYKRFLGYEKGEDDLPRIVEKEAKIIRLIYNLFLEGKTFQTIAKHLTVQNIPTPGGKGKWSVSTVRSILKNEKYKGDALLQKTFTVDFLTKTIRKNKGEQHQYYIENSHPAIITPETFDLVQNELSRRSPLKHQMNNLSPFAAKLVCSECGGYYGSKVWHSADKYKTHIWQCNRKYIDNKLCKTPHIREEELKSAFLQAFNRILGNKERYITEFETAMLPFLADTSSLEKKLKELQDKRNTVSVKMRNYIEENTREVRDQTEYNRIYKSMLAERTELKAKMQKVEDEIKAQTAQKEQIRHYISELKQLDEIITEFDESLWQATVEHISVHPDKALTFLFRDGTEIVIEAGVTKAK